VKGWQLEMSWVRVPEEHAVKERLCVVVEISTWKGEQWIQNLRIGKVSERSGYKSAETRVSKVGCREKEGVERMIGWHWQVGILSKF
jgi:hypothetical protein